MDYVAIVAFEPVFAERAEASRYCERAQAACWYFGPGRIGQIIRQSRDYDLAGGAEGCLHRVVSQGEVDRRSGAVDFNTDRDGHIPGGRNDQSTIAREHTMTQRLI